jgi:GT2 family glycosyltransferase
MMTTKQSYQVMFKTSSLIYRARSSMAEKALKDDFDYMLFIDGDMKFPHDGMDRLIATGQDVVGALCTMRQPPFLPTIGSIVKNDDGSVKGVATRLTYPENAVTEVDTIGMAFTLISRRALEAVRAKFGPVGMFQIIPLPSGGDLPEDTSFCWRVKEAGLKVYCDTGLSILHKGTQMFGEQDYMFYQEELVKKTGMEVLPPEETKGS